MNKLRYWFHRNVLYYIYRREAIRIQNYEATGIYLFGVLVYRDLREMRRMW